MEGRSMEMFEMYSPLSHLSVPKGQVSETRFPLFYSAQDHDNNRKKRATNDKP
jgi:hypothetical protein